MIYIVTALKAEAQAFVDYYRLKKSKLFSYTLFSNNSITLLVSGIGVDNAKKATKAMLTYYKINKDEKIFNIGICAASRNYKIGELIECGTIIYKNKKYIFNTSKASLYCADEPLFSSKHPIADMESYGFYAALQEYPALCNFAIIKIVSDHFEPTAVTKELAKSLIFNKIEQLLKV